MGESGKDVCPQQDVVYIIKRHYILCFFDQKTLKFGLIIL